MQSNSTGSTGTGKSGGGVTPNPLSQVPVDQNGYVLGSNLQNMQDFNQGIAQGQPPSPNPFANEPGRDANGVLIPGYGQTDAQIALSGGTGTGKSMNPTAVSGMGEQFANGARLIQNPDGSSTMDYSQSPGGSQLGLNQQQQMQQQNQFFGPFPAFSGMEGQTGQEYLLNQGQQGLNQVLQQYQPPAPAPVSAQPPPPPPGQITPPQPTPATQQLTRSIAAPTQARPTLRPAPQPAPQPVRQPAPQPVRQPAPQPVRQPAPQPVRQPAPRTLPMARPAPQPVRQAAYSVSQVNPPISRGTRR